MLREVRSVRQIPGEARRRWFSSRRCDLVVWYSSTDEPTGFQLCYNVGMEEKALTWQAPESFFHTGVDDGEGRAWRYKATPILVTDGHYDAPSVIELFHRENKEVPPDISELVVNKLTQYGRHENQKA